MRLVHIFLLVTFGFTSPLPADTYWVSADGQASWAMASSTSPLSGSATCTLETANANAGAGDTVYIRGGNYSRQTIKPIRSGIADDERIIFSSHKGEKVRFEESDGIQLEQKSFITVTGIEFRNMKMFFRILGGGHNTISHCLFDGRSEDSGVWAGAQIGSDRRRQPSTHNWVHHCQFYRFVYKSERPNRGALLDIGNLNNGDGTNGSTHNRIEHNVLAYGGHHTFGVYSKYNVIRFNYIHNETNPKNWDFPGYRGGVTQGTSGGWCLYEGNRFGYAGQAGIGLRSPNNILRRNQFYHNAQGGIQVVTNAVGKDRADENYIYHNTFFRNGYGSKFPSFQGGMYFASWSRVSPKQNVVKNNLFFDNKNGAISYDRPAEPQTIENNWNNRNDPVFADITETGPDVVDQPDLRLRAGSPAIDSAGWLTSVTTESGRGDVLEVADARYFMDGWTIIEGDLIQLEGQSEPVGIVSVDYDNNQIKIRRDVTFTKGQGVSLAYAGTSPDPGAFETNLPRQLK